MSLPSAAAQDAIEALAREAGAIALDHFARVASLPVTMKGHLDLVTEADQAVERFIVAGLRRLFPEDGILGEEGSGQDSRSGRLWVVDPIDGTANFVRGNDQWAVSIGLFEGGHPRFGVIHAPVRGQT
ncbi:MAG: inositol monophosphatase, partial [Proteobacteria bacterium]|nr:inositol monophosphatase [Pseudomonadota bacterium]